MALSRRKFTKEMKLAALQRLDLGATAAEVERKVGQQTVEIDFLKGCLQRIEEERMLQALTGKPRPSATSKAKSKKVSDVRLILIRAPCCFSSPM